MHPLGPHRYEGGWVMDKREGHGKFSSAEGLYTGEWRNNMREGEGYPSPALSSVVLV